MNIYALELNNDIKGIPERMEYIESLIAKLESPDMVVLPELSLCSYMGSTEVWAYADVDSKVTSKWAMEMAQKYSTYIAVGYLEKKGEDYYNSYLIADKDKVYGIVRKSEGESYIFKTGNFPNVINTPIGNIAVAICYDSRRKIVYDHIRNQEISLILFPHGCPSDPNKAVEERKTIDFYCNEYMDAFQVPVVFVNAKGKLDFMMGKTGEMMMKAGFVLDGLSKIYCQNGVKIASEYPEVFGMKVDLEPQNLRKEIRFYGNNIIKGNWLFRKFVIIPDTKTGKKFYQENRKKA